MLKPIAFSIIGLFLGFYFSMVLLPKGNLIFRSAKNVSYFWAIRVIGTVFGDSPSYPAPMATLSVSADTVQLKCGKELMEMTMIIICVQAAGGLFTNRI